MKRVSTIFADETFTPSEMYIDGDRLILLGYDYSYYENYVDSYYYYIYKNKTVAAVYDITDRSEPALGRKVEIDGSYLSSRKIGNYIYLAASSWLENYWDGEDFALPEASDSCAPDRKYIDYKNIYYFPDFKDKCYTVIAGFSIANDEPASVSTYFGASDGMYVSKNNLYLTKYNWYNDKTDLYKFAIYKGKVGHVATGSVPGALLNQFSMDESGSFFRVATTSRDENWINENNVYILDKKMNVCGRIEGIAPDERIYSTRFMGDRLYMVTFKKVDPLFVIDLSDNRDPKILGELKIPGYSDYLHPYDETHLIGFGKDAFEDGEWAYYDGMKLSMFDVTDVANPTEMFSEIIGVRGTDSELLRNHRALLFSKVRDGLFAFPISVYVKDDGNPWYGKFAFQGAYVYNIDMEKGFVKRGEITHQTDLGYNPGKYYYGDYDLYINRIIYVGDLLYTASNGVLKATRLSDMVEVGKIDFNK